MESCQISRPDFLRLPALDSYNCPIIHEGALSKEDRVKNFLIRTKLTQIDEPDALPNEMILWRVIEAIFSLLEKNVSSRVSREKVINRFLKTTQRDFKTVTSFIARSNLWQKKSQTFLVNPRHPITGKILKNCKHNLKHWLAYKTKSIQQRQRFFHLPFLIYGQLLVEIVRDCSTKMWITFEPKYGRAWTLIDVTNCYQFTTGGITITQ